MVDSAIENFVSVYLRKLSKIFAHNENKFVHQARKCKPYLTGLQRFATEVRTKICTVIGVGSLLARTGRFVLHDAGRLCGVQLWWAVYEVCPRRFRAIYINRFLTHSGAIGLCPLRGSPLHVLYIAPSVSFSFGKHSRNACFGILRSSASEFSLISSTRLKTSPFQDGFQHGEEKESTGASSDEDGGRGTSVVSCLARKSRIRREEWARALSWWSNLFSPPHIKPFSPHCLSAFSSPSDNIPCSPFDHEVERSSRWITPSQLKHHFHIGPNLPCFIGCGWRFWDPLQRLGFCLDIIAVNPSFITCDDVR
jgi:hypothetical protein